MPFEVPAGDKDRRFLAEGIAEELIFELGRFRKLFVTSRSATRALEGTQADPQGVGGRLGVRYVLTGTIRQLGAKGPPVADTHRNRYRHGSLERPAERVPRCAGR